MNTSIRIVTFVTLGLCAIGPAALAQSPASSSITYQGRLALDGLAVNEDCDVVFRLYDAEVGGNIVAQVGDESNPRIVSVRKGLFTQPLDFGVAAFNGGERWLEIAVRPTGTYGAFSVLNPRQCVTPTPYALHALTGGDGASLDQAYNKGGPGAGRTIHASSGPMSIEGDGGLVVSGNVGIGTQTPASKLEVAGVVHSTNGGFMFPDGSIQVTAATGGGGLDPRVTPGCTDAPDGTPVDVLCVDNDGNVTVGYNGVPPGAPFDLDVSGTVRATGDILVDGDLGIGVAPANRLSVDGDADFAGSVGIGTNSPGFLLTLDGTGNEVYCVMSEDGTQTPDNFTFQIAPGGGTPNTRLAYLMGNFGNSLGFLIGNGRDAPLRFATGVGLPERMRIAPNGNVGIGTASPLSLLEVNGTIHSTSGGIKFPDNTVQTTAATGDITAVFAGLGLTGGGASGDVTLNVDFAGNGVANTVSRSDHFHNSLAAADGNPAQAVFVDNDGNVGIGTTTPGSKLDVSGDINTTGTVFTDFVSSHSPLELQINGTTAVYISDPDRFVGIDTSSPEVRLHVANGSDVNGATGGFLQLGPTSGANIGIDDNEMQARNNNAPFRLALNASGADVVIGNSVDPALGGNLGIGTSTPGTTIDARDTQAVERLYTLNHGNGAVLELINLTAGPSTYLGAINFYNNVPAAVGQIGYLSGNRLAFRVNSVERVRIDENGNMGIGTTTPAFKLDVIGDANVAAPHKLHVDTITSHSPLALQTAGETHILIDDTTGNVGIGPNGVGPPIPPDEALHVNGCIKADCLKITADNVVEITPLVMTRAGTGLELLPNSNGVVRIHPVAAGTQNVMIPISIPNSLFGVQQKLKSVEICYKATSPTTFINASRVRVMRDAGTFTNLVDDPTDRKSTAWMCYTIAPPPGSPPDVFPPLDGPSFINLELSIGGVAPSYDIEIGRIKLTLTEEVGGV